MHWEELVDLLPLALACFLLGAVEAAAIGRMFAEKYGYRLDNNQEFLAGTDEVTQLAPLAIDEPVHEGGLVAGALRVIHLPGKSPGEIGLYFDPALHGISRELAQLSLLGANFGNFSDFATRETA